MKIFEEKFLQDTSVETFELFNLIFDFLVHETFPQLSAKFGYFKWKFIHLKTFSGTIFQKLHLILRQAINNVFSTH